jgi:probable selenium-dependent hydroxylase accessory protein YqeC
MGELSEALGLKGGGVISLVGAGGKTSLMYRLAAELAAAGDAVLSTTTTRIHPPTPAQSPHLLLAVTAAEIEDRAPGLLAETPHLTAAAGRSAADGKLIGFPPAVIDTLARGGLFRWIIVEADGAAGRPLKAPADHEPVVPAASGWVIGLAGLSALGRPLTSECVHRPQLFSALGGIPLGGEITAAAVAHLLGAQRGTFKGVPAASRRMIFLNQADGSAARKAAEEITRALRRASPPAAERVIVGRLQARAAVVACHDLSPVRI